MAYSFPVMQFSGYIMLLFGEKQLCNEDFFFFSHRWVPYKKDHSGWFKNIKAFNTLTQRMGYMQGFLPKPTST